MPADPHDRLLRSWHDPSYWREQGDKWDQVATLAETDGDVAHAQQARANAAACRQNARLKDVDAA